MKSLRPVPALLLVLLTPLLAVAQAGTISGQIIFSEGQAAPALRVNAIWAQDLTIVRDLSISGSVVVDMGDPLPAFLHLYVHTGPGNRTNLAAEDGVRIRGGGTFGAIPVRRDGTFRLSLRDGEYPVVLVNSLGDPLDAADGYLVKSISSGTTDLLKQPLKVTGGTAQPIVITLTRVKP